MIICDTMIWYKIGLGTISKNQIPDKDLAFTYVSLREMANSANLYKDVRSIEALQNAIVAVKRYSAVHLFDNPFDLISSKWRGTSNLKKTDGEELWSELKQLHKYSTKQLLAEKVRETEGEKRLVQMDVQSDSFNTQNQARKQYVKLHGLKKALATSAAPMEFVKGLIIDFLNQEYADKGMRMDVTDPTLNWNSLE